MALRAALEAELTERVSVVGTLRLTATRQFSQKVAGTNLMHSLPLHLSRPHLSPGHRSAIRHSLSAFAYQIAGINVKMQQCGKANLQFLRMRTSSQAAALFHPQSCQLLHSRDRGRLKLAAALVIVHHVLSYITCCPHGCSRRRHIHGYRGQHLLRLAPCSPPPESLTTSEQLSMRLIC